MGFMLTPFSPHSLTLDSSFSQPRVCLLAQVLCWVKFILFRDAIGRSGSYRYSTQSILLHDLEVLSGLTNYLKPTGLVWLLNCLFHSPPLGKILHFHKALTKMCSLGGLVWHLGKVDTSVSPN